MPKNDFTETFLFKDIFPTEDDFNTFIQEYCTGNIASASRMYSLLSRRFANSSIRYDTVDAFKREFSITLDQFAEKFEFDYEMISHAYDLTIDDIVEVNKAFSAFAQAPNQTYAESLNQMWEYINGQTGNRVTRNALEGIIAAVDKATDRRYNQFIDRFQKHFIRIYGPTPYRFDRRD